jgi:hypothetical protein
MPDGLRLYLDQMFGLDVAAALRREEKMYCGQPRLGWPGLMMH